MKYYPINLIKELLGSKENFFEMAQVVYCLKVDDQKCTN